MSAQPGGGYFTALLGKASLCSTRRARADRGCLKPTQSFLKGFNELRGRYSMELAHFSKWHSAGRGSGAILGSDPVSIANPDKTHIVKLPDALSSWATRALIPDRLMVGHRPLKPRMLVRAQLRDPKDLTSLLTIDNGLPSTSGDACDFAEHRLWNRSLSIHPSSGVELVLGHSDPR